MSPETIGLAAGFMACSGLVLIAFPHQILNWFTPDPIVHEAGVRLLWLAALFQLFDGLQVSSAGVLRGAGDTLTGMFIHTGAWVIGLPIGYWFCFSRNWGIEGIWLGLTIGLVVAGSVLLVVWWRRGHSKTATIPVAAV